MILSKKFKSLIVVLTVIVTSASLVAENMILNTILSRAQRYGKCIRDTATPEERAQAKETIIKDSAIVGTAALGVFVMSTGSIWAIKKCICSKKSDLPKHTDSIQKNDESDSKHTTSDSEASDSLLKFDQSDVIDFNKDINDIEAIINNLTPAYKYLLDLPEDEKSKYTTALEGFHVLKNFLSQLKEANTEYINITPNDLMISKELYTKFQKAEEHTDNIFDDTIKKLEEVNNEFKKIEFPNDIVLN
jgi:hypothetical protein